MRRDPMATNVRWLAGVAGPLLVAAALVSAGRPSAQEKAVAPGSAAARAAGCLLFTDRARAVTSTECRSCHVGGGTAGPLSAAHHPVELEYPAAAPARSMLRPRAEVLERGVFLAEDRMRCVTCHDGRSPWAAAVSLPPGATPTLALSRGEARTGDPAKPPPPPPPGSRVSAKPLCLACHLLD